MALAMQNTDTEFGHSRHSIWLLFLYLVFVPAGILVLNKMIFFYALSLVFVYLVLHSTVSEYMAKDQQTVFMGTVVNNETSGRLVL
ncbi:MAG: hypothetical protein GX128_02720 [Bacteroidales bacterium]|jgi:hypothetical protein|nr:hypothetical protein [Bacteroidales bacterium]